MSSRRPAPQAGEFAIPLTWPWRLSRRAARGRRDDRCRDHAGHGRIHRAGTSFGQPPRRYSRADIYSLGCTMYRLLTGQPPFFGPKYRSAAAKIAAHLREPPPLIRQTREEVSEPLAEVLGRMMAKNPDERYKTPVAVAAALAPHAAGSDLRSLVTRRFEACAQVPCKSREISLRRKLGPPRICRRNRQRPTHRMHRRPQCRALTRPCFVVAAAMLVLGLAFAVGFVRPFLYGGGQMVRRQPGRSGRAAEQHTVWQGASSKPVGRRIALRRHGPRSRQRLLGNPQGRHRLPRHQRVSSHCTSGRRTRRLRPGGGLHEELGGRDHTHSFPRRRRKHLATAPCCRRRRAPRVQ